MDLKGLLKDGRERAELTQSAVARRLDINSGQVVSNWERGLHTPSPRAMQRLIELYGLAEDPPWGAWGRAKAAEARRTA